MGIETLNSAAWAAGFAMAADEDPFEDAAGVASAADAQWLPKWRPGEAVMVREAPHVDRAADRADWVRVLLALFARRAPVSPA
jgi:hypothetical protein